MPDTSQPHLTWTASADPPTLSGWEVVDFGWLMRRVAAPTRSGGRRQSLANPAQEWLDRLAAAPRLAVVGVRLTSLAELRALHGYVLEPAWRTGTPLLVSSQQRLSRLPDDRFVDPGFEYAYTLERALAVAMRMHRPPHDPPAPAAVPAARIGLDPEQRRAVAAHDGVVQVIAPAGSGKTTVLIERVREQRRRGVPATEILATTFNATARAELEDRLDAAGLGGIEARTFHSLGLRILTEEELIRGAETRQLTLNQWKRLCALAGREDGVWIEAPDARAAVSDIKLGLLATAKEYRRRAGEHENGATIARIYELYEEHQRQAGAIDFDDHVLLAVRALREDAGLRKRWQSRFAHVLVDEYQDIEPAQELLVRILAAPEDALFCVGDEDQTLYGWRRASVRRMLDLDLAYPGLERVSLAHNYRCPPEVVVASRLLIERNRVRFPKPILPAPGRPMGGPRAIELCEESSQVAAAERIARALASRGRGEIVVLARTTNLLRTVALACVAPGVGISAPPAVFEPRGARQALEAYLRLAACRGETRAEDVLAVCRHPGRGLPYESEEQVAVLLRDGFSFTESFAALAATERQRAKLDDAGRVLDALASITDAERFIRYLRRAGGLDAYYSEYDDDSRGGEQVELEVLDQAQAEAAGRTVAGYDQILRARADALREIRDDRHGIELTTIHRAKGRQWPEVHVFACEENQLPHRHALDVTADQEAAGEGVEAERRLAYVAFTRAEERLVLSATRSAPSRFLTEAGLAPERPFEPATRAAAPELSADGRHRRAERPASPLSEAERVGLAYALRSAPSRETALELAAAAIEQRLVGPATTSQKLTIGAMLDCVDGLSLLERERILGEASIRNDRILLSRLDAGGRARVARALRSVR